MRGIVIATILSSVVCFGQSDRAQKLKAVHTIYVDGNNVGAERIRQEIEKGKTCFTLAVKPADADAIFAISTDSQMQMQLLGARDYIVSGNLSNKDNELLWSQSRRFGDAPFMNGGKVAGEELIHDLKRQVCEGKKR